MSQKSHFPHLISVEMEHGCAHVHELAPSEVVIANSGHQSHHLSETNENGNYKGYASIISISFTICFPFVEPLLCPMEIPRTAEEWTKVAEWFQYYSSIHFVGTNSLGPP